VLRGTPSPLPGNLYDRHTILHRLLERGTRFTRVQFVDLLSSHPFRRSLESPSDEGTTLMGVRKMLIMGDLEFPALLEKSADEDIIVVERGPGDGMEHACDLRRGYVL
jgi:hypothetical protein